MEAEVVMKEESSAKIRNGLQHMTKSLQELAQQAEQEHVEELEHLKKRQRKDEALEKDENVPVGPAQALATAVPSALQPFGGAHSG